MPHLPYNPMIGNILLGGGLVGFAFGCIAKARPETANRARRVADRDVGNRQSGQGWPVCRPRRPAEQAEEPQPKGKPTSRIDNLNKVSNLSSRHQ